MKTALSGSSKIFFVAVMGIALLWLTQLLPVQSSSFVNLSSPVIVDSGALNQKLNFTLVSTDPDRNIISVRFILPAGMILVPGSNASTLANYVANFTAFNSSEFQWQNVTENATVPNLTQVSFFFNVTVPAVSTQTPYSITVVLTDNETVANVTQFGFVAVPAVMPGTLPSLNSYGSPAWVNLTLNDMFFYDGSTVWIVANYTDAQGAPATGLVVTANFTSVGNTTPSVAVESGNGLYAIVGKVNFSNMAAGSSPVFDRNITVSATKPGTSYTLNFTAGIVIMNMSIPPGCPPNANEIPAFIPLLNGSLVPIIGCSTTCAVNDRAQPVNVSGYYACGPTFGPASVNFSAVAQSGNFSAVSFVLDIPGKVKINFTNPVDMSTQQKTQAIMQFSMQNMMMPGRMAINESAWDGSDTNKPNLTAPARITMYNVTGLLGITGQPQITRSNFGGSGTQMCSTCSNMIWDGENLTFLVGGFSDYGLVDGLNVTLQIPYSLNTSLTQQVTFGFVPVWNSSVTLANCTLWGNWSGAFIGVQGNQSALLNNQSNTINVTVPQGGYRWNVECYDSNNMKDLASSNWTVIVDTGAPAVSLGTNRANNTNTSSTSAVFESMCQDATSLVVAQVWGNWGGSWIANSTNSTPQNATWWNVTVAGIPEGTWKWAVKCIDNAGNYTFSGNRTFTVDLTPPVVTIASGTTSAGNTTYNYIEANVSSSDTYYDSIIVYLYNATSLSPNMVNTTRQTGNLLTLNFTGLPDTTYRLNASANDTAGNVSSTSTRSITVDTTNPVAVLGTNPVDNLNSASSTVTFQISCTDTNVNSMQLWANWSGTWMVNATNSSPSSGAWWNFSVAGIPEGVGYVWGVYCSDASGRTNRTVNRTLNVDLTAPVITINTPVNLSTNGSTVVAINWTLADATTSVDSFWYFVDSNLSINRVNFSVYNISDSLNRVFGAGLHTLAFYANDTAGNSRTTTRTFTVDTPVNITLELLQMQTAAGAGTVTNITLNYQNGTQAYNESENITQNTYTIVMQINSSTTTGANATVYLENFTGSDANWDGSFLVQTSNSSTAATSVTTQSGGTVAAIILFSNVSSFVAESAIDGARIVMYYAPKDYDVIYIADDVGAVTYSLTQCAGNLPPSGSPTLATMCYTNTSANITLYVPHLSGGALVNDTSAPAITIASPVNNSVQSDSIVLLNITVNEANPQTTGFCWYNIRNASLDSFASDTLDYSDFTWTGNTYGVYTLSIESMTSGNDYNITVNCTDQNNLTSQKVNNITVADSSAPDVTAVSASASTTSATITWTTNEYSNSTVSINSGTAANSNTLAKSQSVAVTGLSASTTYYYNVTSCDAAGNCNTSANYNFTTSAASTNPPTGGITSEPGVTGPTGGGAPPAAKEPETVPTEEPEATPEEFVCAAGEKRCSGNNAQVCSDDRMSWETAEVCVYGCSDGACKAATAPPEQPEVPAQSSPLILVLMAIVLIVVVTTALFFLRHKVF